MTKLRNLNRIVRKNKYYFGELREKVLKAFAAKATDQNSYGLPEISHGKHLSYHCIWCDGIIYRGEPFVFRIKYSKYKFYIHPQCYLEVLKKYGEINQIQGEKQNKEKSNVTTNK